MRRQLAAAAFFAAVLGVAATGAAATFTVNSTNDKPDKTVGDGICADADGNCTLRAAIQEANANAGTDTIAFGISGTITVGSELPHVTDPVMIDGGTGTPAVEIRCATQGAFEGLFIVAGSSTVRGLAITQCYNAIVLLTNGSNLIVGNFLGVDPNGNTARANAGSGIYVGSANNVVGGVAAGSRNVVSANQTNGISITGSAATGNQIQGNLVGTDSSGTAPRPNTSAGIYVDSAGNTIGGTTAGAGNLVSGGQYGIVLTGAGATSNTILGNRIGLDTTGTVKLPNIYGGIVLQQGAANNTVGGTASGARNVISGNGYTGVWVTGATTSGNSILGNFIGTDPTGALPLGNAQSGVWLDGAPTNVIGGTSTAARNVISGNGLSGIEISSSGATANKVQGNFIGTKVGGTAGLGNGQAGVFLYGSTSGNAIGGAGAGQGNVIASNAINGVEIADAGTTGNTVKGNFIGTDLAGSASLGNSYDGVLVRSGASGNVIGGIAAGEANVIAHNNARGVNVFDNASVQNTIRGNSIHDNAGLGIDLGGNGVTANDPGDADSGPNDLMNFPEGVTAVYDKTKNETQIRGRIDTQNPSTVRIDLYANSKKDPSNHGQGEKYLASATPDSKGFFCLTWSGILPFVAGTPASGTVAPPPWVSATATSSTGSTSEFSSTKNDVELIALEVNQAVQDWTNSVPFIEKKTTHVRAHIQTTDPAGPPVPVTVQLRGYVGGTQTELPGSPLTPLNFGGFQAKPNEAARRANWNDSINFRLPDAWLTGTIDLRLERTDGPLACNEPIDPKTSAGTCGVCSETVKFEAGSTIPVKFVLVKWTDAAATVHEWDDAHVDTLIRRLIAIYPIASLRKLTGELSYTGPTPPTSNDLDSVNLSLESRRKWDGCFSALGCSTYYYGVLKDANVGGVANAVPGTVASGEMPTNPFSYGRNRHAHELGHDLGRAHAVDGALFGNTTCDSKPGQLGACGECAVTPPAGGIFPNFFSIGSNKATLGPLLSGENAKVFGLDTSRIPGPVAVDPTQNFELMSYCDRVTWRWISDFSYKELHSTITAKFPSAALAVRAPASVQDYLVVRGSIDLSTDAVQLQPIQRIPASAPPDLPPAGSYTLQLQDAGGGVISQLSFEPTVSEPDFPAEFTNTGTFVIAVPADSAIRKAILLKGSTVLASRTASPNPPAVQVLYPNGGESVSQDPVTLTWTASDPDGDPLTYIIQYSPDAGTTWETLALDWPSKNYSLARRFLKGTTSGLIRVIASDGFNTAVDQSNAVFAVANNAPSVSIISPTVGQTFVGSQQMVFEAFAQDVEDGSLSGTKVQWSSNVDGPLGSGPTLLKQATQLSEGTHTITVTATDSGSLSTSASLSITVGRAVPATYADLSVSQTASPEPATVGVPLVYTIAVENQGRDTATLVTLNDMLPSGVSFVSANSSQGNCGESSGVVTCNLGSVPDHGSATVAVTVLPSMAGTIDNAVSVSGKEMDPLPADNALTSSVEVKSTGPTDLSIAESDSPDPVSVGGDILYTISVSNLGPAAAGDVTVTDPLPVGTTFVSAGGTGWACGNVSGTVTCTDSVLPVGAAPSLTVHVKAPSSPGSITNVVQVAAQDADPVPGNDSASETTTVSPVSVVAVLPTSGTPSGGTSVTITGKNFGTGATVAIGGASATNVSVVNGTTITATTPVLPAGTLNDVLVTNLDTTAGLLLKGWFADFADVPQSYLYHGAIEKIVRAGITTGCGGGNYCPSDPVNRSAMAVFILRGEHGATFNPPAATGTVFSDVSTSTFLAKWIETFAAEGITSGCGGGKYCPADPVTRDAMAVFLLKGKNGSSFSPPAATGTVFGDVQTTTFLAKWMEELKAEGITSGCGAGNYCPTNTVTRGEMAAFIKKAFGL